ncbi:MULTISPECIES: hypothetical protein [unclassified Campylobacter]|uniref:hypothetical protein n=1 Tax=unclassified Campylobacter TaxID=2593542 RepID=UPI001BDB02A9|nr:MULTISPECIES: hypothetical protein [unclassified Campylobacter]MBT0879854.1 hypothetical protein [Campylobacter sp. 2018MI27]MBT0884084.1 hypothetical protein [Campylobacter sp. 2018MI10]
MQKGAIDLDIARQTKDDKIAQEQIKTANDMETLKQSQFATKTQPEIFKMQKENHKANLSNTYSIINERKQNMFFKDQAYKEQEEAKKVMSDFNEFSLKFPNLKGDDLKNAYYKHLNYMQMAAFNDPLVTDTPTQIANAQKYLDKQRLFEKHLGYTGQGYRANEDNFNPIPKGGNNSVNASAIIGANLDEVKQAKEKVQSIEQENKTTNKILKSLIEDNPNDPRIKELEQKQQKLLADKEKLNNFINTSQTPMFNYNLLPSAEAKVTRSTEEAVIKTLESIKEIDDYLDFLNGKSIDEQGVVKEKFFTPNSGYLNYIGDKIVGGQGASESVRRFNSLMTNLADKSYKLKVQGDFFAKSITNPSDFWTWSSQIKNDLDRTKKTLLSKIGAEVNQYLSTNPVFYDYITMKYPEIKIK